MLSEERLREIEARATLMQYSGTNPDYKPTEYEMRPCSTMQDVHDLIAEVKRLRPVVEVATEWHTTREALAKADEMSGSEWFIQIGVAMREHQQAADKLATAVGVLGVLAGEVER